MSVCVADIPIGARMRFHMPGGVVREGRILHNYGVGIVLQTVSGGMIEFDGMQAECVEAMDVESASAWRAEISKSQAEFKQLLDKL